MHLIDYGHMVDGVLYHGTLSDLDGVPKTTWSYEKGGKKVTHDQPIDLPTFRSLWNRVGKLDVFQRNRVRDPDRPVDPVADHVISIMFGDTNNPQRAIFAVPADESDPQFLSWIKSLNIPKGSMTPEPPALPARKGAKKASGPAAERERVYEELFGERWTLNRAEAGQGPPIDVYTFKPGEDSRGYERDFYTLVTSGMSDAPMRVPDSAPFSRAELVLYVDNPTDEHVALLRWLAGLPHIQRRTWYGFGTTMPNGNPPQPIFEDSDLDCFIFLHSDVGRDDNLHNKLVLDGDPTALLWVVPITEAECQFILDESPDEFQDLLDRKKHPPVLDEGRRSYIKPGR
jgi:hypothetical protein